MKKFTPPFVRSALNYDTDEVTRETALICDDPSLAQQQFKEETDINFIADRYGLTGEMPQILELPAYGDFTEVMDFQTAQDAVVQANRQFMTLPAKMRARFNNDPQQLLDFLEDPGNRKEAEFLGLVTPRPDPVQDAPQSPTGNAAGEGKGVTPTPGPKPTAEPSKTDTPKT